jgi:hypothetical protein
VSLALVAVAYSNQNTEMSITGQALIWMRTNHLSLHMFDKLVPIVGVLILDECEHYMQDLMVLVHTDCCQYLTFIFFG